MFVSIKTTAKKITPLMLRGISIFPPISRGIATLHEAKVVLGLGTSKTESKNPSLQELRQSYFIAAKACHPDTNGGNVDDSHELFIRLTEAYEYIQKMIFQSNSCGADTAVVSVSEDAMFRRACQEELGLPAEKVEECKRNPGFRQWLRGNTDSAQLWRNFFMMHGGLAPRLRPVPALEANNGLDPRTLRPPRRKQKR